MRFAFYPGCAALAITKEYYASTLLIGEKLGIELVEMKKANCCGAALFNDDRRELNLTMNARIFAQAEEMGLDILTICNTCLMVLSRARKELEDNPEMFDKVNKNLSRVGLEYRGKARIHHLLWVLIRDIGLERIKGLVTNPLKGLKVGAYYGCHILRPSEAVVFEDPDNPKSLEDIIKILGGESVYYRGRTRCCGFQLDLVSPDTAYEMIGKRIRECRDMGGECMVTPCPLCHINLDSYQGYADKHAGVKLDMPIFHLSQLVGLAIGLTPGEMEFSRHLVSPERLLREKNLI